MTEDEDDLERDIRDLLHHPPRESAQQRAIAFAQRRLDRDMQEAARLRRGATRRRVGRFVIATALFILLAAAVATATDSHFLRDVLGKETPLADRVESISDGKVTPTIDRFGEPADVLVGDDAWGQLQRAAADSPTGVELMARSKARVLLDYEDGDTEISIAAAPTVGRAVCYVSTGSLNFADCAKSFTEEEPFTKGLQRGPDGWVVVGLAADEVVSVTIDLDKGQRTALLRNNAYVWVGSSASEVPRAIDIELADGRHLTAKLVGANAERPVRPT